MSITPIASHVNEALARLLEEYKNSPLIKAVISALTDEIQGLEDTFQAIDLGRSIADATGATLDKIAAIVGVERDLDTPDIIFRILILGKIAANVSQGETESVISTYALLTQSSEVTLNELFPASIFIYSNGVVDPIVAPYVGIYLKQALAAGVSIDTYGVYPEEDYFGFSDDPGALGFGDGLDPAVGGGLADQLG